MYDTTILKANLKNLFFKVDSDRIFSAEKGTIDRGCMNRTERSVSIDCGKL